MISTIVVFDFIMLCLSAERFFRAGGEYVNEFVRAAIRFFEVGRDLGVLRMFYSTHIELSHVQHQLSDRKYLESQLRSNRCRGFYNRKYRNCGVLSIREK